MGQSPPPHGEIDFLERFRHRVLRGEKYLTTRLERKGSRGHILEAPWAYLYIREVWKAQLGLVAGFLHEQSGVDGRGPFLETWEQCYPDEPLDPNREVWVHHFGLRGQCPLCGQFVAVSPVPVTAGQTLHVDIHRRADTEDGYCRHSDAELSPEKLFPHPHEEGSA